MNLENKFLSRLLILVGLIFLFSGCNPYTKITGRDPQSQKDSANLAKVCFKIFPLDTVTKTVIVEVYSDSFGYYESEGKVQKVRYDSLIYVENIKYRDTCKSIKEHSKDVCDACYWQGYYNGKKECKSYLTTTTYTVTDKRQINAERELRIKAETTTRKTEGKVKTWRTVSFVLICLLLLAILLIYKALKK
jgi:hypothetical protein